MLITNNSLFMLHAHLSKNNWPGVPTAPAARPRVFVIEPQADSREVLKIMLEAKGYRVYEADGVKQALDLMAGHPPDLILLDPGLGECKRCPSLDLLREQALLTSVPVLITSADARQAFQVMTATAGYPDVFIKPLDFDRLLSVIDQHLFPQSAPQKLWEISAARISIDSRASLHCGLPNFAPPLNFPCRATLPGPAGNRSRRNAT